MQVVTALDNKRPSARLQDKIRSCASAFRSLNEMVNEVIEIGKSEGFTPKEIGQFIRQEMLKSGLSRPTITKYLPAELKAKPRGKPGTKPVSKNILLNQTFTFKSKVARNSRQRHVIIITSKMSQNKEIKPFLGKEVNVTLSFD